MVIFCHGFSGTKDGPLFELVADTLQAHGIASIRFDFNGHGESEGEFKDMTVPNEIEDAKKVVEYVRDLKYVSTIAIGGHSQGGVVAAMTAGQLSEELGEPAFKAVALMAPAAVLRDDAIRGNTMGKQYDPFDPGEYVELWGGLKVVGRPETRRRVYPHLIQPAYLRDSCQISGPGSHHSRKRRPCRALHLRRAVPPDLAQERAGHSGILRPRILTECLSHDGHRILLSDQAAERQITLQNTPSFLQSRRKDTLKSEFTLSKLRLYLG